MKLHMPIFIIPIAILLLAGAFGFVGSSGITSTTVSPQTVEVAVNGFVAIRGVATGYLDYCATPAGKPASMCAPALKNAVSHDVRQAYKASVAARALLRQANGGPIPVASYNTLKTAFDTLQSIITSNNLANHP